MKERLQEQDQNQTSRLSLRGIMRWLANGTKYAETEVFDQSVTKQDSQEVVTLEDPVAEGLRLARLNEEADAYPAADPTSGYPRPLTPGVTVYPDLSLAPNVDYADPKYQEALDMIGRLAGDV